MKQKTTSPKSVSWADELGSPIAREKFFYKDDEPSDEATKRRKKDEKTSENDISAEQFDILSRAIIYIQLNEENIQKELELQQMDTQIISPYDEGDPSDLDYTGVFNELYDNQTEDMEIDW